VHRTRKKTSTYQLTAESRADWQEVAEFFRTVCDIRSERDWELRRDSGEVVVNLTTAQINKRIKKEHANAIPEFTLTLRTKYELSPAEMSEVDVLLRYYSTTNLFRPGDVILNDNGSIREITTLVFNRRTRQFTISAEADAPRCSMKETYQDIMTYLSGITASKTTERKMSFDDEFRKQQTQLYASQIAAREKAALALTEAAKVPKPRRKKVMSSAPIVAAIDEQVVTDDDVDIEPVEEPRRRHRSDDDSC
jgi:hypothetical protein